MTSSRSKAIWSALAIAAPVVAQECGAIIGEPLLNTSDNCSSQPEIDKAFAVDVFRWKNHDYLIANTGNDLQLWNIDAPLTPIEREQSNFHMPNLGDSDYGLLNFSVCDDCRWGAAFFKTGVVLFDLGTGNLPRLRNGEREVYADAIFVQGVFTFSYRGQQYLIATDLPDECPSTSSTLYAFNGIEANDIERIACIENENPPTEIIGGFFIEDDGGAYLYLGDRDSQVHIYELLGSGMSVSLEHKGAPMHAHMIKTKGLAVDLNRGYANCANEQGATLWDIRNPAHPVALTTLPGYVNVAAIHYPLAWTARRGWMDSSMTYDINPPTHPIELDPQFWDPDNPWNRYACENIYDAEFSPDGSALYLARYSVLQVASFAACDTSPPVDPAPATHSPED
jgi:hypothetical protein